MKQDIIIVFDNKDESWDRYTVLIYRGKKNDQVDVYGMSVNANSPNGFNQFSGSLTDCPAVLDVLNGHSDANVGKKVEDITSLPLEVRLAIGKRLRSSN